MKLYLVHCGFYETTLASGIYELHANYLVAAENFKDAKRRAKEMPEYQTRNMHVDVVEENEAVQGHRLELKEDAGLHGQSRLIPKISEGFVSGSRSQKPIFHP